MPTFYAAVDRKRDMDSGEMKISSQYPAWTMEQHIENLKEDVNRQERAIEMGHIDKDNLPEHRAILEREKKRLKEIEDSRPVLSDGDKDMVDKVQKELAKEIEKTMPSYTEMHKGLVDAHHQHRIYTKPSIKMSAKVCELAEENGIRVESDGMMKRKDADKLYKLCGYALENGKTNVERLRKDGFNRSGSTPRR